MQFLENRERNTQAVSVDNIQAALAKEEASVDLDSDSSGN